MRLLTEQQEGEKSEEMKQAHNVGIYSIKDKFRHSNLTPNSQSIRPLTQYNYVGATLSIIESSTKHCWVLSIVPLDATIMEFNTIIVIFSSSKSKLEFLLLYFLGLRTTKNAAISKCMSTAAFS